MNTETEDSDNGCCVLCSVFWDLYCAAPERRDTCEHSSEAKAFHDYVSTTARADLRVSPSLRLPQKCPKFWRPKS